jgi:hypothetical protein
METKEIARQLVEYCRKGDWSGAHNSLYAQNARSIEPYATEDFAQETQGLTAIKEKSKKFEAMVERVHQLKVSEPLVVGSSIAFILEMDVTMKKHGRMNMPELCVYEVKDGKIVTEQFFV